MARFSRVITTAIAIVATANDGIAVQSRRAEQSTKARFYHDGRFHTVMDVANSYDSRFGRRLTDQEKHDLIEYLKSL